MSKTQKSMKYPDDFQRAILRLMMTDPIFCSKACDQLQSTHFSRELSWFFATIKSYGGTPPSRSAVSADIYKHDDKKWDAFEKVLDQICNEPVDALVVKKIHLEMTQFIRANIFVDSCLEAASLYNADKLDEAYKLVTKRMTDLNRVNFGSDGNTRFGDVLELVQRSAAEHANAIPTGLHEIDLALGGGLTPGTWTTFLGASNAGKSMVMPTLAHQAALKGKRVFVTIHEDEEIPTKIRYLSAFSGIEYTRIAYGFAFLSEAEKQQVIDADIFLQKHVVMRFMYTNESTIENVFAKCKELMTEWPYHLYLCDYGQCLTSHDFKKMDSVRHLQEHVYHMMKQLCLELNIAGAGGAQVNRAGSSKNASGVDWLRKEDVAEAWGIVTKSTNVITMNRSTSDVLSNRIVMLLDKSRHGRCPVAVDCESDYSRSTVYKSINQEDKTHLIEKGPSNRVTGHDDEKKKKKMELVNPADDVRADPPKGNRGSVQQG